MSFYPLCSITRNNWHEGEPTCRLYVLQINSTEQEEPDCTRTSHSCSPSSTRPHFLSRDSAGLTCSCSPQCSLLLPGVGLLVLLPGPGATHTLSSASTRGGRGATPGELIVVVVVLRRTFHNHLELNSAASLGLLEFSLVGPGTQTVILQKTV